MDQSNDILEDRTREDHFELAVALFPFSSEKCDLPVLATLNILAIVSEYIGLITTFHKH